MKLLAPIGKLYGLIMDARNALFDRGTFATHSLGARTISVGNITTGGTGKTPLVAMIAEMLIDVGETVCILTRGYGRDKPGERVLVADGSKILADVDTAGDEPFELAHRLRGKSIIVADSNRVAAGLWAREKFGVTTFVLDDGFQHRRVKRDLDIVCIDAMDPCGNGRVLPAGRLRERLSGLKRADLLVVTRSDLVKDTSSIDQRLRSRNPDAPILKCRTELNRFVKLEDFPSTTNGEDLPSLLSKFDEDLKVGAFTALGNPKGFFTALLGIFDSGDVADLAIARSFPDHHKYLQSDIDDIERQAKAADVQILITTAKDAVKLGRLNVTVPCYVAIAEPVIDDIDAFRRLVLGR